LSEDITDIKAVKKALGDLRKIDVVVHAAALVPSRKPTPEDMLRVNYFGTQYIAEQCSPETHFIFLSSDLVFPSESGKIWKPEDYPFPPQSLYSMTKSIAEHYLINGSSLEKISILRTSMLYGGEEAARDNFFRFIETTLGRGESAEVYTNLYSHPTHVEDLCSFIISVVKSERTGIIHACSEEYYNRLELAELICERSSLDKKLLISAGALKSCETRLQPDKDFVHQCKFRLGGKGVRE
jgi:dTDP-4-dehydrorhamnose reductase